jgi:mono/diheme cytochrome c family protein
MRVIIFALGVLTIAGCAPLHTGPEPAPKVHQNQTQGATRTAAETARLVAEGRRLAETMCAGCHAIGVEGDSRQPIAPPFRELSERYPINQLEEAFGEGILVGHPMMPTYQFSEAQIDALIAYIQSIQGKQGA